MKKLLFTFLAVMCCMAMNAQTIFEVDGIKYSITGENTVEVITKSPKYSGDIVIPATVTNPNNSTSYNVTGIGGSAFFNCLRLASITIPEGVTSIGENAFSYCHGLTSVTIPKNVTSIGRDALFSCIGLASITVAEENTVYESPDNCNAIIEKSSHTLICGCKNTIIPNTVTSIGDYAFRGHTGLTSITIPEGVTSIGNGAFWTTGLKSVTIGKSVKTIGDNAFRNCPGMTEIYVYATTPPTLGVVAFDVEPAGVLVYVPDVETYTGWGGFTNLINNDLTTAKKEAIAKIDAAVEGVTDEDILAVANQAKKDISDATTIGSINPIETLALAKIDAMKDINVAIEGVTDEDVLAVANQAKKDILAAATEDINSIAVLALAKINAMKDIYAAIEGVTYEDILAVANQAKKDIVAAATEDINSIKEQALAKINAMKDIYAAIEGVTDEDILAVANQAKKDIVAAATEDINSIKEQALADLAIPLKYYNSGKDDALGVLGTPLTNCPAVKVTKGDKTVILYAPDAVEMIKIPATTNK